MAGKFFTAVLLMTLLAGCGRFEDNGTHLAYALEKGASELWSSSATELVVRYETLDDPAQGYYVEITPSLQPGSEIWSSYLVVSGKRSGGTSYHNRFLFVPARFHVQKDQGGPTELVLRRENNRIIVVAVR